MRDRRSICARVTAGLLVRSRTQDSRCQAAIGNPRSGDLSTLTIVVRLIATPAPSDPISTKFRASCLPYHVGARYTRLLFQRQPPPYHPLSPSAQPPASRPSATILRRRSKKTCQWFALGGNLRPLKLSSNREIKKLPMIGTWPAPHKKFTSESP
jgi:hypothetical protein